MDRKFYRSKTNRMIGGVCGGLGEALRIDPTWIRLFFLVLLLGNGVGFLFYLILWVILPEDERGEIGSSDTIRNNAQEIGNRAREMGEDLRTGVQGQNNQAMMIIGIGLICLGAVFLLQNFHLPWLRWLNFDTLWPVALIVGGGLLIYRQYKEK